MLGLHQSIGRVPSIEMLLTQFAAKDMELFMTLPMKGPAVPPFQGLTHISNYYWELFWDNPPWGNNVEASSSITAPFMLNMEWRVPRDIGYATQLMKMKIEVVEW